MKIEDFITPKAKALQEKHKGKFKTPDEFMRLALKHSVELIGHMLEGNEVLIGKDGKYERYEIK